MHDCFFPRSVQTCETPTFCERQKHLHLNDVNTTDTHQGSGTEEKVSWSSVRGWSLCPFSANTQTSHWGNVFSLLSVSSTHTAGYASSPVIAIFFLVTDKIKHIYVYIPTASAFAYLTITCLAWLTAFSICLDQAMTKPKPEGSNLTLWTCHTSART